MLTRKRLWDFLATSIAIGIPLNRRGERLFRTLVRRNHRVGPL